jgi:hypothetical protein
MTPRQGTRQESSSVRRGTAVVRRTPSPPPIIRSMEWKSITGFPVVETPAPRQRRINREREPIQASVPRVVWRARCACKSEKKKTDCGKARTDRRARETIDKPRKACPCRARWRFAARPDCRTSRNERTTHIPEAWLRQRNASRTLGIATDAILRCRRHSLSRCAGAIGEDCHCDKRDKAISSSPGFLRTG